MNFKYLIKLLLLSLIVFSCKDEPFIEPGKGDLKFSFSSLDNKSLKSVNIEELAYIIFSIDKTDGTHVITSQKIALQKFNETFISAPIAIEAGNYKLTYFAVLDAASQIKYLCPLAGSPMAAYVKNPLSISFNIDNDQICTLVPEVVSVEEAVPGDFGLTDFKFIIYKPISIFAHTYNAVNEKFDLTTASVSISNLTTEIISANLEAKSNIISIPLTEDYYIFKVTKNQCFTYIDTFTLAEIEALKTPLSIPLRSFSYGLIAYYPFNGNANDESGNGNNGTVYGATLTTDRFGVSNKAYSFNGINNYININPSFFSGYNAGTFSAWIKFNNIDNTQYVGSFGNTLSPDDYLSLVRLDPTSKVISIYTHNSLGDSWINGSTIIQPGVYYHVAMTSDGKTWNLYVNGNIQALTPVYSSINTGAWINDITANNFLLGGVQLLEPYASAYLNGVLDDVRLYNRPLDPSEIKILYNN